MTAIRSSKKTLDSKRPKAPKRINGDVKRPPNAFMLYRMDKDPIIRENNPSIRAAEVCSAVAKMWRAEPESVKKGYRDRADILSEQHKAEYPDFKWITRSTKTASVKPSRKAKPEAERFIRRSAPTSSSKAAPGFLQVATSDLLNNKTPPLSAEIPLLVESSPETSPPTLYSDLYDEEDNYCGNFFDASLSNFGCDNPFLLHDPLHVENECPIPDRSLPLTGLDDPVLCDSSMSTCDVFGPVDASVSGLSPLFPVDPVLESMVADTILPRDMELELGKKLPLEQVFDTLQTIVEYTPKLTILPYTITSSLSDLTQDQITMDAIGLAFSENYDGPENRILDNWGLESLDLSLLAL